LAKIAVSLSILMAGAFLVQQRTGNSSNENTNSPEFDDARVKPEHDESW